MAEPDYVVIRSSPDLPEGFMPTELDGRWFDRSSVRVIPGAAVDADAVARAVPTGRFEVREDGAVAEVFEVVPVRRED